MSLEFILRIIGMVVMFSLGAYLGTYLAGLTGGAADLYAITVGMLGALIGLILTPFITTRPARALRRSLGQVSAQTLLAGLAGLMAGLVIAALLAFPLSLLPEPFRNILPLVGVLLFSYLGISVFVMRQNDIFSVFRLNLPSRSSALGESGLNSIDDSRTILLDTSVIIDGRIADIARMGFLVGILLIPRFILNEL